MVIAEAIIGVISNATFQLFGEGYRRFRHDIQTDRELISAVNSAAEKFEILNYQDLTRIEALIRSQEVESVVRQIFSAKVLKKDPETNIELIRHEFEKILSLRLEVTTGNIHEVSNFLFDTLITVCVNIYEEDIRQGDLFAHEIMDNLRSRMLMDELENLRSNIEILKTKDKPTIQEYLEFERKYRQQVTERYRYLSPAHFKNAEKIPLDDLYIYPNFSNSMNSHSDNRQYIKCEDFVPSIYRSVVLGDPGAGKTTFTRKLCYDFGRGFVSKPFEGRNATPILVVLREYGAKFDSNGCSILEYIEEISSSWYQQKPPDGAFEYFLMNGRAFVIFDGLDELLDTSKRQLISDNIESFCTLYPSVPILVTSRKVGYEQAPLSKDRFRIHYISDFDDKQVKEYVEKWFKHNLDIEEKGRDEKVTSFLRESYNVSDLRSNPLMLSLMCDLYRGEGYIPRNRPDVYEKCSELLFKRWDKIRGVNSSVPFEVHLKSTLMYIANEVYSNEALQGGIPERKFIDITVNYLYPEKYDDRDVALSAAEDFVKFCKGRAWVFSEVGSPGIGDNLYQFTHRTFLEYFTAYFLVRNYRTPEDLGRFLLPKIVKREWDVVAQLSFQIQNNHIENAANELLLLILRESKGKDLQSRFNLLSFVARSLEFIVPSPRVIKEIVSSCIDLCIDVNVDFKESGSNFKDKVSIDELINPLLAADTENIPSIRKSLMENISKSLNDSDNDRASSALKIFSTLPYFSVFYVLKGKGHMSSRARLIGLIDETFQDNKKQISMLCNNNKYNVIDGVFYQISSLDDIIDLHGPGVLFSVCVVYGTYPMLASSLLDCIFLNLKETLENKDASNWIKISTFISNLCRKMQSYSIPWQTTTIPVNYSLFSSNFNEMLDLFQKYADGSDSDFLFNLFTIIAPMVEYEQYLYLCETGKANLDRSEKSSVYKKISTIHSVIIEPLLFVFRARLLGFNMGEVEDLIHEIGFTQYQRDLVIQWIQDQCSFLKIDQPLYSKRIDGIINGVHINKGGILSF